LSKSENFSDHSPIVDGLDMFEQHTIMGRWSYKETPKPTREHVDRPHNILLSCGRRGVYFGNEWGLSQNILSGEPHHLPFCQLFDPIRLLVVSLFNRDDEVQYPGVVIENVSFRAVASQEGNHVSVGVQPLFEVRYFVGEAKGSQCALLFLLADGGGEALGNVEDSSWVVLVELHHMFGRGRGDRAHRSRGGPYGGQRANGRFNQSIDGDIGHLSGPVGMMIGTGVVLAEPGVDESVVRGLVIDP
jgi:hypothetical protein